MSALKIRVLSRNRADHMPERRGDLARVSHNADPALHPFEREREYVRAVNAAKLERVFAKPFLGALSGHYDGVVSLAKHPASLALLASGDMCGELRAWNAATRACIGAVPSAHAGWVRGVAFAGAARLLSCGDDRAVREWAFPFETTTTTAAPAPVTTFLGQHAFTGIDAVRGDEAAFVTSGGPATALWDRGRSEPVRTFEWGTETVHSVRCNPVERQLFASTGSDCAVALYDIRAGTVLHKVVLRTRANAVAWNTMEAFHFTCACEDTNLLTFDMRRLDAARAVHEGHVSAVLDVDYSPTGREFASGSVDRTVRIWDVDAARSRDVYHTNRMQRVHCVRCTDDARFVISASDDANVRVWKAHSSEPLRVLSRREQAKIDYGERLKQRFAAAPEIRRITTFRRVPKFILSSRSRADKHHAAVRRHRQNALLHSKHGTVVFKTRAQEPIVTTQT